MNLYGDDTSTILLLWRRSLLKVSSIFPTFALRSRHCLTFSFVLIWLSSSCRISLFYAARVSIRFYSACSSLFSPSMRSFEASFSIWK